MIIKAFLMFILLLVIGGFGYFAFSNPTVQQNQITKTMSLEEIKASQISNEANTDNEQGE